MNARFAVFMLLLIAAAMTISCREKKTVQKETDVNQKSIEQVQAEYTPKWMALPGVVGTGIGEQNGKPCIKVLLSRETPEIRREIPDTVKGYPVVLEVTGEFKAQ